MAEKIQIKAVDMVRSIRDEHARLLAGKSADEIIAFFTKAGESARQKAQLRASAQPALQEGCQRIAQERLVKLV